MTWTCTRIFTIAPFSRHQATDDQGIRRCMIKSGIGQSEGSQHGKQKNFLRIQNGKNPTQDPIYEMPVAKMVRSNLLPSKIEQTRFVGAGVG